MPTESTATRYKIPDLTERTTPLDTDLFLLSDASGTAYKLPYGGIAVKDSSITTAKLNDGAVTEAKLGAGAVTDAKLVQSGGVLSEVHDIRVGADGTTYASAGDAVRGQLGDLKSDLKQKADQTDMLKAFPTDTASGAVASFADGANVPVKSLIVNIDPVQSGSGDPSPTNVRPISGWSEVNVSHSGADMTNPTVINIQLGQTVYGGKLDVLSGVLTVARGFIILDGTTTGRKITGMWTARNSNNSSVFYLNIPNSKRPGISDILNYTVQSYNTMQPYTHGGGSGANGTYSIAIPYDVASSVVEANAWLAEHNVTIVYPLTTPIEVQLSHNQINSLYGQNNIWADSGDTEVEYRADTKLFIERLTAPDSADMIADANITSGKYFMVGNTLYKATANIASGATISPNVNCARKSLSEALNELNS